MIGKKSITAIGAWSVMHSCHLDASPGHPIPMKIWRKKTAVTEILHRLRCPHCGEAITVDGDKETKSYCLKCQQTVEPVRRAPERSMELIKAAHLANWTKARKGNTGGGIGR